mgnify:CR=1 FL=1
MKEQHLHELKTRRKVKQNKIQRLQQELKIIDDVISEATDKIKPTKKSWFSFFNF